MSDKSLYLSHDRTTYPIAERDDRAA